MLVTPGRMLGAHTLAHFKAASAILTNETATAFLTTEDGLPLA